MVEHSLGKGEVTSSILVIGSRFQAAVKRGRLKTLSLKQKLLLALTAYVALAFLAWQTLGDEPLRVGQYFHVGLRTLTLVILGLFAFRTLMTWRRYDDEKDKKIE